MSKSVFFGLVLLLPLGAFGQAEIREQDARILHVATQHPKAADENPGTEELPLKSIGQAIRLAEQNESKNLATRILIGPGTYREQLSLKANDQESDAPTILEAKEKGSVIISGSDPWTGWSHDGESAVYSHAWKEKFAPAETPEDWKKHANLKPLATRREVIFVDGKLLQQVLTRAELKEGCCYVDEAAGKVWVWPAGGTKLETAQVDVAVRPELVVGNKKRGLVLRGLTFRHANSSILAAAVQLDGCQNVLVEDCLFEWNNGTGLRIRLSQRVTVRQTTANHNGSCGFDGWRVYDYLVEDVETSYNNWRGAWGEFYGWAQAGAKHLAMHRGTYRRFKSVGNQTRGFWFDFDCADLVMDDVHLCDNFSDGINIECNQGPITLRNSKMCNNGGVGVSLWSSSHVTLENNIIFGNGKSQFVAIGKDRPSKNYETGEESKLSTDHTVLKDNIFACKSAAQKVMTVAGEDFFLKTLTAGRNLYFSPEKDDKFFVADTALSFAEWQLVSGQDSTSTFADPRFVKPEAGDFALQPDSPLKRKQEWAVRAPGTKTAGDLIKERRQAEIRKSWETPYPLAKDAREGVWTQIDLKANANRALTGPDAWIGMPLENLAPGVKKIHGVPFEIVDEQKNQGMAVVVLRSAELQQSKGKPLPSEVTIPFGQKAQAVYILHGCGWGGSESRKVGQYRLIYDDGTQEAVDVRVYGNGGGDYVLVDDAGGEARKERILRESNIQDWWPTVKQFDNEQVHKVIVPQGENPMAAYRYLYSMQITNPHPEKRIREIQLVSDPNVGTTILVLAATALGVP